MQEARHCGEQEPARTCDEDILVTFGFTICVSKPLDSTNLPWVVLCTMVISLIAAYTVAIVCITTNLDRSCCPESNRTASIPLRQVAEEDNTIRCNRTAGQCGRGPGTWYCAAFPEKCLPSTPSPATDIPSPRTSTPTMAPSTAAPTTPVTPATPRTWCKCPTPSSETGEAFELTLKVEKEVNGARRVETLVGNEIFLDAETEVEIEMDGCDKVKTNFMRYNEMSISLDEQ